jgi:hypothetical protein
MRSLANRPTPSLLTEHEPWLRRLAQKYHTPRAVLARQLSMRGALEYEIAQLIADIATQRAHELFAANDDPPAGMDIFDRAIRGVYNRLETQRIAAEEAERQKRYAETDAFLKQLKEGRA